MLFFALIAAIGKSDTAQASGLEKRSPIHDAYLENYLYLQIHVPEVSSRAIPLSGSWLLSDVHDEPISTAGKLNANLIRAQGKITATGSNCQLVSSFFCFQK